MKTDEKTMGAVCQELEEKLSKMQQCPVLLEEMLDLAELVIKAYATSSNAQVTLHFADGLIRRVKKEHWELWKRSS